MDYGYGKRRLYTLKTQHRLPTTATPNSPPPPPPPSTSSPHPPPYPHPHPPGVLLEGVAVLEAARGLEVVEEAVDHLVPGHERGRVVVPLGAEQAVRVGEHGELRGVGHGWHVPEPPPGGRVEVLIYFGAKRREISAGRSHTKAKQDGQEAVFRQTLLSIPIREQVVGCVYMDGEATAGREFNTNALIGVYEIQPRREPKKTGARSCSRSG